MLTSAALARRLDTIAFDYQVTRYSGPGNPMGTQILRAGELVATKVPYVPTNALMNTAHGLQTSDDLDAVLAFYAETAQPCWVETSPCTPFVVTTALVAGGFRPEHYGASLFMNACEASTEHAERESARDHSLAINRVAISTIATSELDTFLDTMNLGFGSAAGVLPGLRRNQSFWPTVPSWKLFLARVDGEPAGAAVLSIHAECAYLAAASTLPSFRGRGIQNALIAARLTAGAEHGCTEVLGQAEWGSSSARNMQRAGLAIHHVRTLWTNRP